MEEITSFLIYRCNMGEFVDATTFTMEVTEVMEHKWYPWIQEEASDLIWKRFLVSDRIEGTGGVQAQVEECAVSTTYAI